MTNVRTRVLTEAGEWKEADKPSERLPKTRRFTLTGTSIFAEGVCWSDGAAAIRLRGDQRATIIYDTIEDVIAANPVAELSWVD